MKAITYGEYGDPSVLRLADVDLPEPATSELLVRVVAAGVNPIDARMRRGEMRLLLPGGFPRIPGYDVAGVVESAPERSAFAKGELVIAYLGHIYGGGYAEFVKCTDTHTTRIPDDMPIREAAALPLAGSTALQILRDHGKLAAEDEVLILGASGGVGAFATQIAKAMGGKVTAVASRKHESFVRSLGAEEFVAHEEDDFRKTGRQWDLICDIAGVTSFLEARPSLTEHGRYVTTEPSLRSLAVALFTLPRKKKGRPMLARSRQKDLRELVDMYRSRKLSIHVHEYFALADAALAHDRLENSSFPGKLVLDVSRY